MLFGSLCSRVNDGRRRNSDFRRREPGQASISQRDRFWAVPAVCSPSFTRREQTDEFDVGVLIVVLGIGGVTKGCHHLRLG